MRHSVDGRRGYHVYRGTHVEETTTGQKIMVRERRGRQVHCDDALLLYAPRSVNKIFIFSKNNVKKQYQITLTVKQCIE